MRQWSWKVSLPVPESAFYYLWGGAKCQKNLTFEVREWVLLKIYS